MELSPGSLRTFVVGTSYQLGNLASSASSTIESELGSNYPLEPLVKNGKTIKRYNYGKVICIFMGAVYAYVILLTFVGPEKRGRSLNVQDDADMAEVTHRDLRVQMEGDVGHGHHGDSSEDEKIAKREDERV